MKRLVIFGVGDFARTAYVYLRDDSEHDVVAFTVNESYIDEPLLLGVPVVPFESLLETHPPAEHDLFVAVGFSKLNTVRAQIYEDCKQRGYELISYVNSRATVSSEATLGDNCFVFEENVIQPFVTIGNDVVLWSGNHIGHDVKIGDHCFIASHVVISGNVEIGSYCFLGVNATLRDGIRVAPRCLIGAGAVILRDTEEGDVYAVRQPDVHPRKSWELDF